MENVGSRKLTRIATATFKFGLCMAVLVLVVFTGCESRNPRNSGHDKATAPVATNRGSNGKPTIVESAEMTEVADFTELKPLVELPFTCCQGLMLIEATVGDDISPRFFIFDTCGSGLLDRNAAMEMGLEADRTELVIDASGGKELESCSGIRLNFGKLEIDTSLILLDLEQISTNVGHQVDGVVGHELLSRYTVFVDNDRSLLQFFDPKPDYQPAGFTRFEAKLQYHQMFLCPGAIQLANGQSFSGEWMLDTGCGTTAIIQQPFSKANRILHKAGQSVASQSQGVLTAAEMHVVKVKSLSLGEFEFDQLEVKVSGATQGALAMDDHMGILGNTVLKRFNIIFDLRRSMVYPLECQVNVHDSGNTSELNALS